MTAGIKYVIYIAMVLLAIAIGLVWWHEIYSSTTADTRGRTEQREDTVADGTYRIAAYEQFYDMCASVQSTEGRIQALETELADDPSAARKDQIQASLTALRSQRTEAINEYNAEARKTATSAQFKASDLPDQLDPNKETTCAAN